MARTENARAALSEVLSSLQDAETGQRGFLLTGKDGYLEPYNHGIAALPAAFARLDAGLRAGPPAASAAAPVAASAAPIVAALRAVAADKLAELAETLALAHAGNHAAALNIVQADRGQHDMQAIRQLVTQVENQQRAVLSDQIAAVNRGSRLLVAGDVLGFVLLALLASAIAWGARQAFAAIRAAQAGLAEANGSLEDRVAQRTTALTEANDEIQRFAYIVSHDLRAPLVNIMGFTSEMEAAATTVAAYLTATPGNPAIPPAIPSGSHPGSHPTPALDDVLLAATEDIPESIRFIKTSAAKMDRLIGAILKLSREGRRTLAPDRIPMRPFLETIVASMQHQAGERGATVTVGAVPDLSTDRLVLEQIFSNLIENALKYLQPGRPGQIGITGRPQGARMVYEVQDNGRGIATRDLERVFELFRRAGDQTVPGEGIGLAHVRALVRRLGGSINCVSAVGVGSTFRVELPRAPMVPEPPPEATPHPPRPQQSAPQHSRPQQPATQQETSAAMTPTPMNVTP